MPDQPAYDPQTLQERDPAREIAWTCWNSGDPFLAGSHEGADKIRGLLQEIKELRARLEADVEIGRRAGEISLPVRDRDFWQNLTKDHAVLAVIALRKRAEDAESERDGHDKPCYYCGQDTDDLSGDPGQWGIPLCHSEHPGVVQWHHAGCVSNRLAERDALKARLGALPGKIDKVLDRWLGQTRPKRNLIQHPLPGGRRRGKP